MKGFKLIAKAPEGERICSMISIKGGDIFVATDKHVYQLVVEGDKAELVSIDADIKYPGQI